MYRLWPSSSSVWFITVQGLNDSVLQGNEKQVIGRWKYFQELVMSNDNRVGKYNSVKNGVAEERWWDRNN